MRSSRLAMAHFDRLEGGMTRAILAALATGDSQAMAAMHTVLR